MQLPDGSSGSWIGQKQRTLDHTDHHQDYGGLQSRLPVIRTTLPAQIHFTDFRKNVHVDGYGDDSRWITPSHSPSGTPQGVRLVMYDPGLFLFPERHSQLGRRHDGVIDQRTWPYIVKDENFRTLSPILGYDVPAYISSYPKRVSTTDRVLSGPSHVQHRLLNPVAYMPSYVAEYPPTGQREEYTSSDLPVGSDIIETSLSRLRGLPETAETLRHEISRHSRLQEEVFKNVTTDDAREQDAKRLDGSGRRLPRRKKGVPRKRKKKG